MSHKPCRRALDIQPATADITPLDQVAPGVPHGLPLRADTQRTRRFRRQLACFPAVLLPRPADSSLRLTIALRCQLRWQQALKSSQQLQSPVWWTACVSCHRCAGRAAAAQACSLQQHAPNQRCQILSASSHGALPLDAWRAGQPATQLPSSREQTTYPEDPEDWPLSFSLSPALPAGASACSARKLFSCTSPESAALYGMPSDAPMLERRAL